MTLYSYLITLHYIFSCGLRTVYLINLKNLIWVDIVKCLVKFCFLLDLLHIILFLTNLASTGGPHQISPRAACGPRAAGWTALIYTELSFIPTIYHSSGLQCPTGSWVG